MSLKPPLHVYAFDYFKVLSDLIFNQSGGWNSHVSEWVSEWKSLSRVWVFCDPMDCTIPWNSPGQNTGVGSLFLLWGSSQPMVWTQVSCIAGRFFISWASREAQLISGKVPISSTVQWLYNTVENVLNGIWRIHLCNCINVCFSAEVLDL